MALKTWVFNFDERASGWFADMIKVAVVSARENTSLSAVCLYDGEGNPPILNWLVSHGVTVIRAQVPFREELFSDRTLKANEGTHYHPQHASGAFLRLVIPDFVGDDFLLYTDCDVMFESDPAPLFVEPNYIAACPEVFVNGGVVAVSKVFNSGVMILNRKGFLSERDNMLDLLRENNFYFKKYTSYDQTMLNIAFSERWSALPAVLNWRPFQGANPEAKIVHFHGPKPAQIGTALSGLDDVTITADIRELALRFGDEYRHFVGKFNAYLARV